MRLILCLLLPSLLVLLGMRVLADVKLTFLLVELVGFGLAPWLLLGARPWGRGRHGLPFADVSPRAWRWGIGLFLLCGGGLVLGFRLLTGWLLDPADYLAQLDAMGFELEHLWVYGPIFALLVPLMEEWWWRGQALPRCVARWGRGRGLLVAAAGFASYHAFVLVPLHGWGPGALRVGFIFLAGWVWCRIALARRSWFVPWLGHLGADLGVVIVFLWLIRTA